MKYKELIELAESNGLLIGCVPDTFMGAGLHTCRKIFDDGLIGDVIGATAFMVCHGHKSSDLRKELKRQSTCEKTKIEMS